MSTKQQYRKNELARIHIMKTDLCLGEDVYRDLLAAVTGKRSCKDMNIKERFAVIHHMQSLLKPQQKQQQTYPGKPSGKDWSPQIGKIEALLADNNLSWGYAHAIAKRMYKIERVQWCDTMQLRAIISALVKKANKKNG